MSLDTFHERGSAINLSLPFRPWADVPTGDFPFPSRLSLLKFIARSLQGLTWTIRTLAGVVIPNVKVWLSSADIYTAENLIPNSIRKTDASGNVSYELMPDTVYYGWRFHSEYTWTDPFRFRYSTANSRWEYWNGTAYAAWTP